MPISFRDVYPSQQQIRKKKKERKKKKKTGSITQETQSPRPQPALAVPHYASAQVTTDPTSKENTQGDT